MGGLLSLLILFTALAIIWYLLKWVAGEFGVPDPVIKILTVILVLIFVIALFGLLFGVGPGVGWVIIR